MAQSFPDYLPTLDWRDILALPAYSAAANKQVTLQSKYGTSNLIFFGGAAAPDLRDGFILPAGESVTGNTGHIWVRGEDRLSILVPDGQDSFVLASANASSGAVTVEGGDYVFSQTASAYGTVKLQILGPNGTTWLDLISLTATDDTGSGTGIALPNGAQLRIALTGTTGAYATLKRVP